MWFNSNCFARGHPKPSIPSRLTCCLLANQGQALLPAVDGDDADHVLGAWQQVGEGDGVPWGRHPLLLGPGSALLRLVADPVARDGGTRSDPVHGEGVRGYIWEVEAGGGIKTWVFQETREWAQPNCLASSQEKK